jgi:chromosome partitioning protein
VEENLNEKLSFEGFIITMFEKNINDQKDMLEQFKKESSILGIVKKSADTYRSVLDGIPVVMSAPKSDVAQAYKEIAEKI